nr:helix-turn-helix transcriptional regulator [Rhodovibrio sodomensis]
MTTHEVADYLRIKERRVYELVRQRQIPCTRATGKWLFPRALVDRWVAEQLEMAPRGARETPPVVAGSHDPLLDWAVKESGCGLALLPGGSLDGLKRLADGEARLAGLHLFHADLADSDPEAAFNIPNVKDAGAPADAVLLEWARRSQGLVVPAGNPDGVAGLGDLAAKRIPVVRRQAESGSGLLLDHLARQAGLGAGDLSFVEETARSEMDLGLAILEGRARAGVAVEAVARSLQLGFVPLMQERFDLLLGRRDYFGPAVQSLIAFARSDAFADRARRMGGYDVGRFGAVHYNAP